MIDSAIYTVTSINGFRRSSLTLKRALDLAGTMNATMRRMGWRGRARVWYRDGSEISLHGTVPR